MSAPLNLLVTGGAGFIGSCFVAQAMTRGHKIVVLDALTYAGNRANLDGIAPANWRFVQGNIADGALVAKLLREHNVDGVVNFAAESHVDNSIAAPAAFIETNVTGVFGLLEAVRDYWQSLPAPRKTAFRFLQISTDEVYGSLGATGAFSEDSPMRPNSPYSASKAAGDHFAHAWFATYGLPVIITRSSNNFGPRQHAEKLIPHTIRCALGGDPMPVYGDGKHIRDWLHVEDHCAGLWLALERGTPGETYLFGGSAEMKNLALVEKICTILDAKRPLPSGSYRQKIAHVADRPGHDFRYAIDDAKARRTLGFTRTHVFEKSLEKTVEWYLGRAR